MQDIRRATKKHRKVLLTVVIVIMLGLVGFFGAGNSSRGGGGGGAGAGGEYTLEQQIAAIIDNIASLKETAVDYYGYLGVASTYMELCYNYMTKYNNDNSAIPELAPPEYDEEGNEIELSPDQAAERAAAEAERDAAVAAAAVWQEYSRNAAAWAVQYYQKALDNVPDELNDAGIADIRYKQAQASDMADDKAGALSYMIAACELAPDNINLLRDLVKREKEINTFDGSIRAYLRYIDILKEGLAEYFDYSNVASVYLELNDIYNSKYNADLGKVPPLPTPELDEEGNEIPLDAEQETEMAAARARHDAANLVAQATKTAADNAAIQAEDYFQQALDKAPDTLGNEDIANLIIGKAGAREARGDVEGAIAFINEARALNPQKATYLVYLASLEQSRGNDDKARELYIEARTMDPENFDIAYNYAQSLLYSDNPADSVAEMQAYRDALPEGHASISQADQAISTLQMYADLFASFRTSNVQVEGDDTDQEDEGGGIVQ